MKNFDCSLFRLKRDRLFLSKLFVLICGSLHLLTGALHARPIPEVHLSAQEGVVGGQNIQAWQNQGSVTGLDATQADTTQQPRLVAQGMNDQPSILFDRLGAHFDFSDHVALNTGRPYTGKTLTLALETGADVNSRQVLWEQGGGSRGLAVYIDAGEVYFALWGASGTTRNAYLSSVIEPDSVYIVTLVFDAGSARFSAYVNGERIGQEAGVGELLRHGGDCAIGAVSGSMRFHDAGGSAITQFSGELAEFYSYNTALNDADREQLEEELLAKYIAQPPVQVESVSATISSPTEILLSWQHPDAAETSFVVEFREVGGIWREVGRTAIGETALDIIGLVENTDYEFRVFAENTIGSSESSEIFFVSTPVASPQTLRLNHGVITGVGSEGWVRVELPETYNAMVVLATPRYGLGDLPAVTRVRAASGDSFEIRVQNPSGSVLSDYEVHFMVVEQGVYNEAEHGVTMEAVLMNSTTTQNRSSWGSIQSVNYLNSYTNPVVLGQVMSENDPRWSVFWASAQSRQSPPDAANLKVGKHVGHDSTVFRADEILGYIVIEASSGQLEGVNYQAALGADTVRGFTDNPVASYPLLGGLPTPTPAKVAILSSAAMDGGDGGWPVLFGDYLASGQLSLVFDEDQIGDAERAHTTEQVAHIILDAPEGTDDQDEEPDSETDEEPNVDADTDNDGLADAWERLIIDAGLTDQNADGVIDLADVLVTDDFDNDGLTNLEEFEANTNATSNDSDGDGQPDWQELLEGTDPNSAASLSPPVSITTHKGVRSELPFSLENTGGSLGYTLSLENNQRLSEAPYTLLNSQRNFSIFRYEWVDIETTGTRLPLSSSGSDDVDRKALPFAFPFYGEEFNEIFISGSGFITLEEPAGATPSAPRNHRAALPNPAAHTHLISVYQQFLDPATSGEVYYQEFADRVIIQWEMVKEDAHDLFPTFQAVLYADGRIRLNYDRIRRDASGRIAEGYLSGIQNADGSLGDSISWFEGRQMGIFFAASGSISILYTPDPGGEVWLGKQSENVEANSIDYVLNLETEVIDEGEYEAYLNIHNTEGVLVYRRAITVELLSAVSFLGGTVNGTFGSDSVLNGNFGDDHIQGFMGDDLINGGSGEDTLDGGLGDDTLAGGSGADIYIIRPNEGHDLIDDFNEVHAAPDVFNVIRFAEGIDPATLTLTQSVTELLLGHFDTVEGDFSWSIRISNWGIRSGSTGRQNFQTWRFEFADGTVWGSEILDGERDGMIGATDDGGGSTGNSNIDGTAGDDRLEGTTGDDILNGKAGDDSLIGGLGNDIFIGGLGRDDYFFERGDGEDTIRETLEATNLPNTFFENRVFLPVGIELADLNWVREGTEGLRLSYGTGDSILFENWFSRLSRGVLSPSVGSRIWIYSGVSFRDELLVRGGELVTEGADYHDITLSRSTKSEFNVLGEDDVIIGGAPSSGVIIGGEGNDLSHINHGSFFRGTIEYRWSPGDGNDLYSDTKTPSSPTYVDDGIRRIIGNYVIRFMGDVLPSDIEFSLGGTTFENYVENWVPSLSGRDLRIIITAEDSEDSGSVVIKDWLDTRELWSIQFENDSTIIDRINFTTQGGDELTGNMEDNTLNGGEGDDVIRGGGGNDELLGGIGNDQIFGELGDDTINGGPGNDQLFGGPGKDVFQVNALEGTDTLFVDSSSREDEIVIEGAFWGEIDFLYENGRVIIRYNLSPLLIIEDALVPARLGLGESLNAPDVIFADGLVATVVNRGSRYTIQRNTEFGNYIDSNKNAIPDWWERLHFRRLVEIDEDEDGDGVIALEEYTNGTNPNSVDTDADGFDDRYEIDSEAFDPLSDRDKLLDHDFDRFPSIFEIGFGTDPLSADSFPVIDAKITADPRGLNEFTSLEEAIRMEGRETTLGEHLIVEVNAGVYVENFSLTGGKRQKSILILASQEIGQDVVVRGQINLYQPGLSCYMSSVVFDSTELRVGDEILCHTLNSVFVNSSILVAPKGRANAVHASITNCEFAPSESFFRNTNELKGDRISIFHSLIDGNNQIVPSISNLNDSLDLRSFAELKNVRRYLDLNFNSEAIDYLENVLKWTAVDRYGEPRDEFPDVGADEWVSTDGDRLPDWFEIKSFRTLDQNESGDFDNDGLSNFSEWLLEKDAAVAISQRGGQGDLYDAYFGFLRDESLYEPSASGIDLRAPNASESVIVRNNGVEFIGGRGFLEWAIDITDTTRVYAIQLKFAGDFEINLNRGVVDVAVNGNHQTSVEYHPRTVLHIPLFDLQESSNLIRVEARLNSVNSLARLVSAEIVVANVPKALIDAEQRLKNRFNSLSVAPTDSLVSPVCVEGFIENLDQLRIQNEARSATVSPYRQEKGKWYANLDLYEDGSETGYVFDFEDSQIGEIRTINHSVQWRKFDVFEHESYTLRVGDSLRLTAATGEAQLGQVEVKVDGVRLTDTNDNVSYRYQFDRAGVVSVNVIYNPGNGEPSREKMIPIIVVNTKIDDLLAVVGRFQKISLDKSELSGVDVELVAGGDVLKVGSITAGNLRLRSRKLGTHPMAVRLPNNGPIIDSANLNVFNFSNVSSNGGGRILEFLPDGSRRIQVFYTINGSVPAGFSVDVQLLFAGAVFEENGLGAITLRVEDFVNGVASKVVVASVAICQRITFDNN